MTEQAVIPCPTCHGVATSGPGPCATCVRLAAPRRKPARHHVAYWRRLPDELRCVHCGKRRKKARGLCHKCHSTHCIRERYEVSDSPSTRRAEPDCTGTRPLPDAPTTARPGSEDKLAVLAERAARRQQLHHPDDHGIRARRATG